jgi:regulatory protein
MIPDDDTKLSQIAEFIQQAKYFCAYQERCSSEVFQKLSNLGIDKPQQQTIMDTLINEGYIDDQRFAVVYAQGKFKNNHWGRIKIFLELTRRGIPNNMIKQAIEGINEEDYNTVLQSLIDKKMQTLKEKKARQIEEKTAYFCSGKGFEPELVWKLIKITKS